MGEPWASLRGARIVLEAVAQGERPALASEALPLFEDGLIRAGVRATMIGFRDERAVVHVQYGEESMALLRGNDSVAPDDEVEVLIIDDFVPVTGEVVMTLDHASQLVQHFLRTGDVGDHEDWFQT